MNDKLRERLAAIAHTSWSGWMTYLFSKSQRNEDGSVTIPPDLVRRWTRQVETKYDDLPENEQASDLEEADVVLDELRESLSLGEAE